MESATHEHMGTDGPIGRSDMISGDQYVEPVTPSTITTANVHVRSPTQGGVYGAHALDDESRYAGEPHTASPMNTGKYGTDASHTVQGYGQMPQEGQGEGLHGSTTDCNAIRKADTPY